MSNPNDCYGWALSNCCGSTIKHTDRCSDCGENCDNQCTDCDDKDTCEEKIDNE